MGSSASWAELIGGWMRLTAVWPQEGVCLGHVVNEPVTPDGVHRQWCRLVSLSQDCMAGSQYSPLTTLLALSATSRWGPSSAPKPGLHCYNAISTVACGHQLWLYLVYIGKIQEIWWDRLPSISHCGSTSSRKPRILSRPNVVAVLARGKAVQSSAVFNLTLAVRLGGSGCHRNCVKPSKRIK